MARERFLQKMYIHKRNDRVIALLLIMVYCGIVASFWAISVLDSDSKRTYEYHPIPFEPEVVEDFQTIDSDNSRIPHIMHFIFITGLKEKEGIPTTYFYNVKLFSYLNPNWTIYFWSDIPARQLISSKYPTLLTTWDSYTEAINKADALRYVVLYEFGGVYSDLDTIFVRSLDRVTMKYACVISPEPFEHSAILYQRPFQLNNGFLLCRKKHPFMKQVISSLPRSAQKDNILKIAGPQFLTKQFILYNKLDPENLLRNKTDNESNSPYFYKGALKEDDFDAVYVPNTRYFMNTIDWGARFDQHCLKFSVTNDLVKRGCQFLKEREHQRDDLNRFSYIDHRWMHMYSIDDSTELLPAEFVIPKAQLKIWRPDGLAGLLSQQPTLATSNTRKRTYSSDVHKWNVQTRGQP